MFTVVYSRDRFHIFQLVVDAYAWPEQRVGKAQHPSVALKLAILYVMDKPDISQARFLVRAFLHSTKQPGKRTTNTEAIALVVVYMVYITNGLCKKIVNKSIGSMIFMLTTRPFFY